MRSFTFAFKAWIIALLLGLASTSYTREVNIQEEIGKLFESGCHRDIDNRREWIYNWVTREVVVSHLDSRPANTTASPKVQNERLEFLKANWGHKNFLPFEGYDVRTFFDNYQTTFLVRLSTSVPGAITVTWKGRHGAIWNTRFNDLKKNIDEIIAHMTERSLRSDGAAEYIAVD